MVNPFLDSSGILAPPPRGSFFSAGPVRRGEHPPQEPSRSAPERAPGAPKSPDEYAEIQFATQEDANDAVERLNVTLQTAMGLSLSASWGMQGA